MAIEKEIVDQLLAGYEKPEDLTVRMACCGS